MSGQLGNSDNTANLGQPELELGLSLAIVKNIQKWSIMLVVIPEGFSFLMINDGSKRLNKVQRGFKRLTKFQECPRRFKKVKDSRMFKKIHEVTTRFTKVNSSVVKKGLPK